MGKNGFVYFRQACQIQFVPGPHLHFLGTLEGQICGWFVVFYFIYLFKSINVSLNLIENLPIINFYFILMTEMCIHSYHGLFPIEVKNPLPPLIFSLFLKWFYMHITYTRYLFFLIQQPF